MKKDFKIGDKIIFVGTLDIIHEGELVKIENKLIYKLYWVKCGNFIYKISKKQIVF